MAEQTNVDVLSLIRKRLRANHGKTSRYDYHLLRNAADEIERLLTIVDAAWNVRQKEVQGGD